MNPEENRNSSEEEDETPQIQGSVLRDLPPPDKRQKYLPNQKRENRVVRLEKDNSAQ
jgi:hypothetical protein